MLKLCGKSNKIKIIIDEKLIFLKFEEGVDQNMLRLITRPLRQLRQSPKTTKQGIKGLQ